MLPFSNKTSKNKTKLNTTNDKVCVHCNTIQIPYSFHDLILISVPAAHSRSFRFSSFKQFVNHSVLYFEKTRLSAKDTQTHSLSAQ